MPSGNLSILRHAPGAAVKPQIRRGGIFDFGVALQDQPQETVARHHIINEADALGRFHHQRGDGAGKNDNVGQAEDGKDFGKGLWTRFWFPKGLRSRLSPSQGC